MRRIVVSFFALILCTSNFVLGEELSEMTYRLQLFNDCRPVGLLVEDSYSEHSKIRLSEGHLQLRAERHLSLAGLYSREEYDSYVKFRVNVNQMTCTIVSAYFKPVFDEYGNWAAVPVWNKFTYKYDGGEDVTSSLVASTLLEAVEEFIVEYLRINEPSCKKQ